MALSCKDKDREGHDDLESLEMCIRSSMHNIGSIMLEKLLNADGGDYRGVSIPCDNGHAYEFVEYRNKDVLTVLGEVKVIRAYYYDRECGRGICPKDEALDIEGTSFSPGVRRIMGRAGAYRAFGLGHDDIKEMAGFSVTAKEIERISNKLGQQAERFLKEQAETSSSEKAILIKSVPKMYVCMDGTGVPMVKADVTGRQGKGETGQAKTREAKLGCIFTQTTVDKERHPVRDEGSTSYTGAIETAEEFGKKIYSEAGRRGIDKAEMVCVIGDGAPWIWNIADEHLYGATQIIDLYHAREHYWNVARIVLGNNKKKLTHWTEQRRKELNKGKVGQVINAIKRVSPCTEVAKEICDKEISYFEKNKERMRYDVFKRKGFLLAPASWKQAAGQSLGNG